MVVSTSARNARSLRLTNGRRLYRYQIICIAKVDFGHAALNYLVFTRMTSSRRFRKWGATNRPKRELSRKAAIGIVFAELKRFRHRRPSSFVSANALGFGPPPPGKRVPAN